MKKTKESEKVKPIEKGSVKKEVSKLCLFREYVLKHPKEMLAILEGKEGTSPLDKV